MKHWHQPSGLCSGLALMVDASWTTEQALAVLELLGDLQDRIWIHYGPAIQELLREQRVSSESVDNLEPDLPF